MKTQLNQIAAAVSVNVGINVRVVTSLALLTLLAACSDPERIRSAIKQSDPATQQTPQQTDNPNPAITEEVLDIQVGEGLISTQAEKGRAQAGALTVPAVYIIQSGDTLFAISLKYGLPMRSIIALNTLRPPYHLQQGKEINLPQQRVHVVTTGDTLYAISRQYGTNLATLARLNQLSQPYEIKTAQRLLIPSQHGAEVEATQTESFQPTEVSEDSLPQQNTEPTVQNAAGQNAAGQNAAGQNAATKDNSQTEQASSVPVSVVAEEPPPRSGPGFLWPLHEDAKLLERFGPQSGGRHNDGLNLATNEGNDILAAENGVVAYIGDELAGFGQLM
ncbi:MAG: LysM peptidoglycan-binding domain-containing protein, partial [Alphaproteobacteria bacterium]